MSHLLKKIGAIIWVKPSIATQDGRSTSHPFYVVFSKKEIVVDGEYHSGARVQWVNHGSGYYEEADAKMAKRLDVLHANGREFKNWARHEVVDIDVFETACFTEEGANDYLRINGHNLRQPFIYVHSLFRNNEMLCIREAMLAAALKAQS